jgi:dihydroflavonol-4-reductase
VTGALVLVTGGTGFVGAEVVRHLAASDREVHALRRRGSARSTPAREGVHWYEADLVDGPALHAAFEAGAAAARTRGVPLEVVHLAAAISYRRRDRALLRRVNVEGTRRVLDACIAVGARRLCHVSSVVALGPVARADQELDDDAPLAPRALDSAYARTKAEAEALVLGASAALDVVVASPAVVFGVSGSASNSLHFLRRVLRGTLGPLSPPGSISVVGLADAAQGILLALERGARGRRYLLGESAWRLHELLSFACRIAGRTPPRGVVPRPLWRVLVGAATVADLVAHSERATPEALALLGLHFRFRARRARAELGWTPRPFAEVLGEVIAALRAGGGP